ncbi:MAG: AhpC/TSA family protein [Fimbriimonadaceae bacterium]|nr:AhpC/TSA family protein [Fimbriimonadaceae bacterium]
MAELREHDHWNVAFVVMANEGQAEAFRKKLRSPHRFICDPDKELYLQFGLGRGSVKQMFGWESWRRGAEAAKKGHSVGAPVGDPWQMGGSFVLDRCGTVIWEHRNTNASDNPTAHDIGLALGVLPS